MGCSPFKSTRCVEYCDRRSSVKCEEKASKYIFENSQRAKELCKLKVDECLISTGPRCDDLVLNCTDNSAYLVELKGNNMSAALGQMKASYTQLAPQLADFELHGRIVSTRPKLHRVMSSEEAAVKKLFKQNFRAVKSGQKEML